MKSKIKVFVYNPISDDGMVPFRKISRVIKTTSPDSIIYKGQLYPVYWHGLNKHNFIRLEASRGRGWDKGLQSLLINAI